MLRRVAITLLVSLVCVSVVSSQASYSGTLFITTYDLEHDNNTLVAMNPNTGDYKSVSGYSHSVTSTDYSYDVDKNMYYVIAGGEIPHVDFINATDGSIVGGAQLLVKSFYNSQFESATGQLVGVVMTDSQMFVQRVSLATGVATNIATLDSSIIELLQDSSALDQSGRIYYCTVGDTDNNNLLLYVNLATGQVNATKIDKNNMLSPATYSPALGCFFGYKGPEGVCIDRSGNAKTIIKKVHGIVAAGGWTITHEGSRAGSLFAATVDLGPYYVMTYDIASGAQLNQFNLPCGVHFMAYFPHIPYHLA